MFDVLRMMVKLSLIFALFLLLTVKGQTDKHAIKDSCRSEHVFFTERLTKRYVSGMNRIEILSPASG